MAEDQDKAAGVDTSRHLNRARAALREAVECLEDAAAASEHPSVNVTAALSHVAAARKSIRPWGFGEHTGASEVDAA